MAVVFVNSSDDVHRLMIGLAMIINDLNVYDDSVFLRVPVMVVMGGVSHEGHMLITMPSHSTHRLELLRLCWTLESMSTQCCTCR